MDGVNSRASYSILSKTSDRSANSSYSLSRQYQLEHLDSQRADFELLLKEGTSWKQCFLHRGHIVNLLFFIVMAVGLVLNEVFYRDTGFLSGNEQLNFTATKCYHEMAGCFVINIARAIGLFGFAGGTTNWIAVELLFVKVPLVYGSGVIDKQYVMIREAIKRIIVEVLFNPTALDEYLQSERNSLNKTLNIESFGNVFFNDTIVTRIVSKELEKLNLTPEGLQLSMMGVDVGQLNSAMMLYIRELLLDIKPLMSAQLDHSQLLDAVGTQEQLEMIVQNSLNDLKRERVRQLVAVMLRSHLSTLIIWGCIFGAIIGLVTEAISIAYLFGTFS